MNIHEFQAKALLRDYNIPTLNSAVARSGEEALKAAQKIGGKAWVVKAQVHAGGRGKGGGIQLVKSLEEVFNVSQKIIGKNLVTPQTRKEGEKVHQVLIEEAGKINKEFYLAFLVNRNNACVSLVVSREGGVDIEETAQKAPDRICRVNIDPAIGLCSFQKRDCSQILNLEKTTELQFFKLLDTLYSLFLKEDLSLLEINPLVLTEEDNLLPLDAKMSFDSNASYRHPDWSKYVLPEDLKELSTQARMQGFSFVPLDGNIGCMVNGAGLAMATMDMIQLFGGKPANFLDVGGDTDSKRIQTAFQFILKDTRLKGILINIFGGIVRCDLIAQGIIKAAQELNIKPPLVVRLEGNSADTAKSLLQKSDLNIISVEGLKEATQKIISLST